MRASNPDRERAMLATLAVAPVVALDIIHAQRTFSPDTADYLPSSRYTSVPPAAASLVRYADGVESIPADESETLDAIVASMHRLHERTKAKFGEAIRVSL